MVLVGVTKVTNYPGAEIESDSLGYFLNYSARPSITTNNYSIYNENVDPREYGYIKGFLRRPYSGGDWNKSNKSGSRSIYADDTTSRAANGSGARGCINRCISKVYTNN